MTNRAFPLHPEPLHVPDEVLDDLIAAFYDKQIPADVVNGIGFEKCETTVANLSGGERARQQSFDDMAAVEGRQRDQVEDRQENVDQQEVEGVGGDERAECHRPRVGDGDRRRQHEGMPYGMTVGPVIHHIKDHTDRIQPAANGDQDQHGKRQLVEEPPPAYHHDPAHQQVDDCAEQIEPPGEAALDKHTDDRQAPQD